MKKPIKIFARFLIRQLFKIANTNMGCGYIYEPFKPLDNDTIEDGFGNLWSAWCSKCGRKSMVVDGKGGCQCEYCG